MELKDFLDDGIDGGRVYVMCDVLLLLPIRERDGRVVVSFSAIVDVFLGHCSVEMQNI